MTKFYRDAAGSYIGAFDGAEPPADAIEVAMPPDNAATDVWDGAAWVPDPARVAARDDAAADGRLADAVALTVRDVLFDQENRIRALEGRAAVAKAQFSGSLKAILKGYQ